MTKNSGLFNTQCYERTREINYPKVICSTVHLVGDSEATRTAEFTCQLVVAKQQILESGQSAQVHWYIPCAIEIRNAGMMMFE